jgi:hypothetical protein
MPVIKIKEITEVLSILYDRHYVFRSQIVLENGPTGPLCTGLKKIAESK